MPENEKFDVLFIFPFSSFLTYFMLEKLHIFRFLFFFVIVETHITTTATKTTIYAQDFYDHES